MSGQAILDGIYRSSATQVTRGARSVIFDGAGDNESLPADLTGLETGTTLAWEGPEDEPTIELEGCENITFRNMSFHRGGVRILRGAGGLPDTSSIRFENVTFAHCKNALWLSQPGDSNVDCSRVIDATFRSCEEGIVFDSNQATGWDLSLLRFLDCDRGIWCKTGGGFSLRRGSFGLYAGQVGVDLQYVTDSIELLGCSFECQGDAVAIAESMFLTDPPQRATIIGGRIDSPGQAVVATGSTAFTWVGPRVVGPTVLPGVVV